jgi:hypothetical protein
LYHNLGAFLLKMCQSIIVYINIQSALIGVEVLVIRTLAWPLIGSFLLEFTFCGLRMEKRQKYHIQMLVHWLLFTGLSYCDNRERVFMFDCDTKEKEHQNTRQSDYPPRTNQIASCCSDALSLARRLRAFLQIR